MTVPKRSNSGKKLPSQHTAVEPLTHGKSLCLKPSSLSSPNRKPIYKRVEVSEKSRMSSILITGSHGYLGSRLYQALIDAGHAVTRFQRKGSAVESDCATYESIIRSQQKFDFIVHTATLYQRHGESEAAVREANVAQPQLLLDYICSQSPHSVFLNIDTALRPEINVYAATKHEFRLALERNGTPYINLVLDQFYGPGDSDKKFHVWLTRRLLFAQGPIQLTTGEQSRNLTHVDDLVRTIVDLIKQSTYRGTVRLMGPDTLQIRELAAMICRVTGEPLTRLEFGKIPQRIAGGDELAPANNVQILSPVPPNVPLETGLRAMIEYELRHATNPQG